MQPGERQSHLGFSTGRTRNLAPARPLHKVLEQRRLTGPFLAAQDEYLALSGPDTGHQPIQHAALDAPAKQLAPDPGIRKLWRRHGRLGHVHVSGAGDFLTGKWLGHDVLFSLPGRFLADDVS
jgi:hypothetical protein